MKLWCENQMIDKDDYIICLAHLAEGRVFDCPYENNEKRMKNVWNLSIHALIIGS